MATTSTLAGACRDAPNGVCRYVYERTENVGLSRVASWLASVPLHILLVLIVAYVVNRIVRRSIRRLADRIDGAGTMRLKGLAEINPRAAARAQTVSAVLRSMTTGVISIFAIVYILGALGVNLGPLIAGAGVAGLAIGFGAQSLVRDFLSGIFILVEDQYGVGDVVDVGEATGTVEGVTLRITRLRDANGTVWYVPNGEIARVGNKSQQWAMAVIDIAVAPTVDLDRAAAVIDAAAITVWASEDAAPDVLDRPEVLGVDYLGPDAAVIRIQGKTRPGAQWRVSRLLRVRIAEALGEAGIDLPPSTFMRPGTGR